MRGRGQAFSRGLIPRRLRRETTLPGFHRIPQRGEDLEGRRPPAGPGPPRVRRRGCRASRPGLRTAFARWRATRRMPIEPRSQWARSHRPNVSSAPSRLPAFRSRRASCTVPATLRVTVSPLLREQGIEHPLDQLLPGWARTPIPIIPIVVACVVIRSFSFRFSNDFRPCITSAAEPA